MLHILKDYISPRQKNKTPKGLIRIQLVARRGFEPPISALRGRRPKPLDDRAMFCTKEMAGVEGVEPSHTAPETAVLPLDDTPVICVVRISQARIRIIREN